LATWPTRHGVNFRTPAWAMSGAFFVTQPMPSFGHNDRVAWGITAGHVDNTDLFVERFSDASLASQIAVFTGAAAETWVVGSVAEAAVRKLLTDGMRKSEEHALAASCGDFAAAVAAFTLQTRRARVQQRGGGGGGGGGGGDGARAQQRAAQTQALQHPAL
jgi:hypothetical protein